MLVEMILALQYRIKVWKNDVFLRFLKAAFIWKQ